MALEMKSRKKELCTKIADTEIRKGNIFVTLHDIANAGKTVWQKDPNKKSAHEHHLESSKFNKFHGTL